MKKIPLTQGKFALVDDADFEWLSQWPWHASKTHSGYGFVWYAKRPSHYGQSLMHGVITGSGRCDHRDGNGLNNQRSNLRPCTRSQNGANSFHRAGNISGFKGVSRNHYKWRARIMVNRREISLGGYDTPELAARAYDIGAVKYFGEFAKTNF